MANARASRTNRSGPSRARFMAPVVGGGLLIVLSIMLFGRGGERHTVSHVVRTIRQAALAGNEPDAPFGAGAIGPWNVAAERVDPMTGELHQFRLESGQMMIAAKVATIVVDPDADTFGFELTDVVYTRVPEGGRPAVVTGDVPGDGTTESFVHTLDRYSLGPAPYGVDIVPDAPGRTRHPRPEPLPEGFTPLSRAGLDD